MSKTGFTRERAWNIAGVILAILGWFALLETRSGSRADFFSRETGIAALAYLVLLLGVWLVVRGLRLLAWIITR